MLEIFCIVTNISNTNTKLHKMLLYCCFLHCSQTLEEVQTEVRCSPSEEDYLKNLAFSLDFNRHAVVSAGGELDPTVCFFLFKNHQLVFSPFEPRSR